MTQPISEKDEVNSTIKILGVMALIEMVEHVSQVVGAFGYAGIFSPEGNKVLKEKTEEYFDDITNLLNSEREIEVAKRGQK